MWHTNNQSVGEFGCIVKAKRRMTEGHGNECWHKEKFSIAQAEGRWAGDRTASWERKRWSHIGIRTKTDVFMSWDILDGINTFNTVVDCSKFAFLCLWTQGYIWVFVAHSLIVMVLHLFAPSFIALRWHCHRLLPRESSGPTKELICTFFSLYQLVPCGCFPYLSLS